MADQQLIKLVERHVEALDHRLAGDRWAMFAGVVLVAIGWGLFGADGAVGAAAVASVPAVKWYCDLRLRGHWNEVRLGLTVDGPPSTPS